MEVRSTENAHCCYLTYTADGVILREVMYYTSTSFALVVRFAGRAAVDLDIGLTFNGAATIIAESMWPGSDFSTRAQALVRKFRAKRCQE